MSGATRRQRKRIRRRADGSARERRREDLSLYEVAYILWERKFVVLGAILICAAAASFLTLSRTPSYTVEAVVIVQPSREDLGQSESEVFLEEVSGIVASDEGLFEQATERSGWDGSPSSLRDRLEPVYFVRDSGELGLEIRFTSVSPGSAARAANAYATLFVARARELEDDRLSGDNSVLDARVEAPASALEARTNRRPVLYAGVGFVVGLILGGAIALLIEGRTRSWRDARDAEMTLHAPVLGVIPDYEVLGLDVREEDETQESVR